jgi:hypothetical protein
VLPANHPAAARMRAASPIAIAKIAQGNPRPANPLSSQRTKPRRP